MSVGQEKVVLFTKCCTEHHPVLEVLHSAKCASKCCTDDTLVLEVSDPLLARRRESWEPCVTPGGAEMEPIGRFMISKKN